jgi:hypothetical protein
MTKRAQHKSVPKKRGPRRKATHAITPTQAEFMMALWKFQHSHNHRGATGEELKNPERSLDMVRKMAMILSKADPPYIVLQTCSESRGVEKGKRKIVSFTRYFLTENVFVKWPRDGIFLLEARRFEHDQNGTKSIAAFREHLKANHNFTDAMFEEDWPYVVEREYLHVYGDRFVHGLRLDNELEWLELMAIEHKRTTS